LAGLYRGLAPSQTAPARSMADRPSVRRRLLTRPRRRQQRGKSTTEHFRQSATAARRVLRRSTRTSASRTLYSVREAAAGRTSKSLSESRSKSVLTLTRSSEAADNQPFTPLCQSYLEKAYVGRPRLSILVPKRMTPGAFTAPEPSLKTWPWAEMGPLMRMLSIKIGDGRSEACRSEVYEVARRVGQSAFRARFDWRSFVFGDSPAGSPSAWAGAKSASTASRRRITTSPEGFGHVASHLWVN
jgi:hypothetical protein